MPASDDEIDDRRDAIRKRVREAIWLDVAVLANDLIHATGDKRHVFLERIHRVSMKGKTSILEFDLGS